MKKLILFLILIFVFCQFQTTTPNASLTIKANRYVFDDPHDSSFLDTFHLIVNHYIKKDNRWVHAQYLYNDTLYNDSIKFNELKPGRYIISAHWNDCYDIQDIRYKSGEIKTILQLRPDP